MSVALVFEAEVICSDRAKLGFQGSADILLSPITELAW